MNATDTVVARAKLAALAAAHGWEHRRISGEADRYIRQGQVLTVTYRHGDQAVTALRHCYIDGAGHLRRETPNVDGDPVTDPATLAVLAERTLALLAERTLAAVTA